MVLNKTNISKFVYIATMFFVVALGIYLRISAYLTGRDFWHDECSLAVNFLYFNNIGLFGPLLHQQSAPPLFLLFSKFFCVLFPYKIEFAARFVPLLCSVLAIPLFYKLSTYCFSKKWVIVIANLLFAINYQLIYYSQEFKQYSSDVFFSILLVLIFVKTDIFSLDRLKQVFLSVFIAICPLFSLPSAIVILASEFLIFCKNKQIKPLLLCNLPFIIINVLYYFMNLKPSKDLILSVLTAEYWRSGLLNFNPLNILCNLNLNFKFFFTNSNLVVTAFILFAIGIYFAIKSEKRALKLCLCVITFAYMLALLNVYPLAERLALYLIPFFLLILLFPLEQFRIKEKKGICVMIFVVLFLAQFNFSYIRKIVDSNTYRREAPNELLQFAIKDFDSNYIFIYNDASDSEYELYSALYGFEPKRVAKISLAQPGTDWYTDVLDSFPKGNTLVFYYPYDYRNRQVVPILKSWVRDNTKVIEEKDILGSYYARVKN